ncbi:MAG: molybdopterin molybdotransferase MoeA [Acidobacteriota bacterium]|nr:MAG: molybdopterin molybdotransferase MoeA [Acidobacteriota bacterium]
MLQIEEALRLMLERTPRMADEVIGLSEAAGRVLRRDAVSDMDLPPFDRARMDGFAFRSADTLGASPASPLRFRTAGEAAAGHAFGGRLGQGEAIRIMTGAPAPEGADAVEKIEVIRELGDGLIEIEAELKPGQFITPRGIEARSGEVMVPAGAVITPAVAAVLASFGSAEVLVSKSPRVALLSTGSELVEVGRKPGPSQIRNSNTYSLSGYVARAGGVVVSAGIVRDDLNETRQAISRALETADVLILSGGVSMGDYDLVKPALRELGAEIAVEKVAMHPGKPTVFARIGQKVVFGLPGNPVSVAVSFHLFARPALLKMQGATEIELPRARVLAAREVKGAPPRRSHQPALLRITDGRIEAEPLKWSGSSDLVAFMRAEALIVVPEDRERIEAGEIVEIISIGQDGK